MTDDPIRDLLMKHLGRIAPDISFDDVDPGADLREEYDIDSMDFMTLITALGKELSLPMPEGPMTVTICPAGTDRVRGGNRGAVAPLAVMVTRVNVNVSLRCPF